MEKLASIGDCVHLRFGTTYFTWPKTSYAGFESRLESFRESQFAGSMIFANQSIKSILGFNNLNGLQYATGECRPPEEE